MRWNSESVGDEHARLRKRHRWFAWYPVFCYSSRKTVWLEFVLRRGVDYSMYFGEFEFEYKELP